MVDADLDRALAQLSCELINDRGVSDPRWAERHAMTAGEGISCSGRRSVLLFFRSIQLSSDNYFVTCKPDETGGGLTSKFEHNFSFLQSVSVCMCWGDGGDGDGGDGDGGDGDGGVSTVLLRCSSDPLSTAALLSAQQDLQNKQHVLDMFLQFVISMEWWDKVQHYMYSMYDV